MHAAFPDLIIIKLYNRLKGNWLVNFGLGINEEIFENSDSIINIINGITDEFYSLLNYCMEYSKVENGIIICPHYSFTNSHSWQQFKDKIEKKLDLNIDSVKFESMKNLPRK